MLGYRTVLIALLAALAAVPLEAPGAIPVAAAADHEWHDRDRDNCGWIRTSHGREWGCLEGGGRGDWGGRRGRDWGDRDRWHWIRHDNWGDCFRTPWGLACETRRPGVYRVRDWHRGDEPGPDCDLLIIEDWGWRCVDSPRR